MPEFLSGPVASDKIIAMHSRRWKNAEKDSHKPENLNYFVTMPIGAVKSDIIKDIAFGKKYSGGDTVIVKVEGRDAGLSDILDKKKVALYEKRFKAKFQSAFEAIKATCDAGKCAKATSALDAYGKKLDADEKSKVSI